MTLLPIVLFVLLLMASPALLGWALRVLLIWCWPQSQWHVDRSHLRRIAQLLCVLGVMVLVLFWLSQVFSHAACLIAGSLFYGPGLFMLAFFTAPTEEAPSA